jgi:hypothetical protein
MPPDFTPDVKDLISKMLVLDPHKRIKVCFFSFFLSLSLPFLPLSYRISHPFCQRRHPSFPTDALFLASPPELIDIKEVLASRGGMDDTAFQSLQVLLPDAEVGDLYRALHMSE